MTRLETHHNRVVSLLADSSSQLVKYAVRRGLKRIVLADVPLNAVGNGQVLVQPQFSLISSGTETASIKTGSLVSELSENPSHIRRVLDSAQANGPLRTLNEVRAKFDDDVVLGYAGAGVIADHHRSIVDIPVGSRVAYGGEGTGHGEFIVTGRQLVASIPDNVSFEDAAFATIGAIAMNAVRIAKIELGETVAVVGLGLVGQVICQLARLQGARVVAVDLDPRRVSIATDLGAEIGLPTEDATVDSIRALTAGRGVDCAIVAAAAKSSAPTQAALSFARDRGRLVVVGAVGLELPWHEMYLKEIQLLMARAYGPGSYDPQYEGKGHDYPLPYVRWTENRNMQEFLRLIGSRQVNVSRLVSHTFDHADAERAYQQIMGAPRDTLAVLLKYPMRGEDDTTLPSRTVAISADAASNAQVSLALVGVGNIARWAHLQGLDKLRSVHVRAMQGSNGVRANAFARRFRSAYSTTSYQTILDDAQINAVVVTSRNPAHGQQTLQALRAGKHVFVEKPMSVQADEALEILAVESKSGLLVQVGFNRRFAPVYRAMKRAISNRTAPAVLNIRMCSPGISGDYWMADPSIGGAILGEACHFVDLAAWLLDAEPVRVFSASLPVGGGDPIGQNNLSTTISFSDGSIASLTYTTVGHPKSQGERVEAFVPGRTVVTEDFRVYDEPGRLMPKTKRPFASKGYDEQMDGFVQAIRGARSDVPTARDGARSTLVCLAMLRSAEVRSDIELDPTSWR